MKRIVLLALSSLASCGWSPAFAGAPLIRPRAKSPVLVPLVKPLAVRAALFSLRPDQIDYKPAPPSGGGLTPGASPVGSATNCLLYADGSSVLQCAATEAGYDGTIATAPRYAAPDGTAGDPSIFLSGDAGNDTGFYRPGANSLSVSINGVQTFQFGASSLFLLNSTSLSFGGTDNLVRHASGVLRSSTGSDIRGFLGGGANVASAAALPVPTGRVFHVTGTTNVTSITSTNFAAGAVITLIFDDVLTFTDGNNLVLAGNFVTTTSDVITLVYDGTNWYETSRSVN